MGKWQLSDFCNSPGLRRPRLGAGRGEAKEWMDLI